MDKTFLIYDAAAVLTVVIAAYIGSEKGMLRMVLSLAVYIAALIGASFVSDSFSEPLYRKYFRDSIVSAAENTVDRFKEEFIERLRAAEEKDPTDGSDGSGADTVTEKMIDAVLREYRISKGNSSENYDEDRATLTNVIAGSVSDGDSRAAAKYLEEKFIRKRFIRVMEYLLWSLSFTAILAAGKLIMRIVLTVRSSETVRFADSFLGMAAGAAEGLLILFTLSVFIKVITGVAGENAFLSDDLINQTYFFRYIYNLV